MGLKLGQNDPKYLCHQQFYQGCENQCELLILENVTEYDMENVVSKELSSGWCCKSFKIDPRLFGFAAARPRCYGVAWKRSYFRPSKVFTFEGVIDSLLATPQMTAKDFFTLPKDPSKLTPSSVSQLNWFPSF